MTNSLQRSAAAGADIARRRGMTLIEVILAVVILSGAMLGLADFGRRFQHQTSDSTSQTLASDLATQRIEQIKGWRVYSTLASTYNGVVENFGNSDATYSGFRRTTAAVACSGCPTATNDYVTITVTVTGRNLTTAIKKTTIIAAF
jgi:prepilin-type N-terminal cleavage/methylation domain-containing protein